MRIMVTFFLIMVSIMANAYNWPSPTDKKYKAINPELYAKFNKAREINDNEGENELVLIESLLREVIGTDKNFAPAYRELGRVYITKSYISGHNFNPDVLAIAESNIRQALEIEPDYADSYVLLGLVFTYQQRFKEAQDTFDKAEKLGTESVWLPHNKAYLYSRIGKEDEALPEYEKIAISKTAKPEVLNNAYTKLAEGYSKKGLLIVADKWHQKNLVSDSKNPWAWGNYASFLIFKAGKVDESIEKFEKALSISNYGLARFHYACALYTKWAITVDGPPMRVSPQVYFDKAFEIYPDFQAIIKETNKYPPTKIAARKLTTYTTENN